MKLGLTTIAPYVATGHDPDDAIDLRRALAALAARVLALEAAEAERRRRRLHPGDRPFLLVLLPPLSGAWGPDENFVRDMLEYPSLARLIRDRTVKQLAAMFRRAAGVAVGGFILIDCGIDPVAGVHRYRVDGV